MIVRIILALLILTGAAQAATNATTPWTGAYVWGNEYKNVTGAKPGIGQFYQTVQAELNAGIDTIRFNVAPTSTNGLIRYGLITQGVLTLSSCSGGTGWTTAPVMTFSPPFPGGRIAKAHAIVSGGIVTSCVIDDGGDYDTASTYGTTPIISISGPGSGFAPTANIGTTYDSCTHTGATCFVQYLTNMLAGNVWDNPHLKRIIINMRDSTTSALSNPWIAATLTSNASAIQAEFLAAYQAIYNRFGPNTKLQFISDNWEGDNDAFVSAYTFQQGSASTATGSIANNILTITACTSCATPFASGAEIGGYGIPYPTIIAPYGTGGTTGTGLTGTYTVTNSTGVALNVGSETILYPYQAQAIQAAWGVGVTNQQRAAAFTQWIGYKDAALSTFHATYPNYPIYISEEFNFLHAWDGFPGTPQAVSSMTWSNTSGGQLAVVMTAASPILLGENVTVYGATNTGTGGTAVLNNTFLVSGWTDSQHFVLSAPASVGVYGTIAGTITAGLGPYACRGACNGAPGNSSTISPDGVYASIVASGARNGPWQMCSESDYESFGNNTLVTDANLIMNGACPNFYIGEYAICRVLTATPSNTDILHYNQQAPFLTLNPQTVTSAPQVIGYTPWNGGEGIDISQECGWFLPTGAQDLMTFLPSTLRPNPHFNAAYRQ